MDDLDKELRDLTGTHWCRWCRINPDRQAPEDMSAITFNYIENFSGGEPLWDGDPTMHGHPDDTRLHLHELYIANRRPTIWDLIKTKIKKPPVRHV
jgi:hypothetical protein